MTIHPFRTHGVGQTYPIEYFVSISIPADEPEIWRPIGSRKQDDGTSRLDIGVGYAKGDLVYAYDHVARIEQEHPGWKACVRKLTDDQVVLPPLAQAVVAIASAVGGAR